jgi:two-component system sensor histidine kinase TctE
MPEASRWSHWSHWSLRRTLLTVLIPGLLLVMGLEIIVSWRTAVAAANAAFDRSLLGAVKAMDANISTASGGLSVELPYRMLEFFELTASGQVFYSVHSGDGLVQIGNAELPPPPALLVNGAPQFYDASYFGTPVRVGAYARLLDRPLSQGSQSNRVLVQVAETLESRQDFTRQLVLDAFARDALLMMAALALVVLAVQGALRPLQRLRMEVVARRADDLAPVRSDQIPADVAPLVDALNEHARRYRDVVEQRRRFVDDASHQLRTPLTTLSTQMGFALRERDPVQKDAALQAMARQLADTIRQTNQMLALARADAVDLEPEPLDLSALAEATTKRHWPLARERGIDLGLDCAAPEPLGNAPTALRVEGHEGLLAEALSNLLHNALLNTPPGGRVTVQTRLADGWAELCVRDDGPGMKPEDRARVGERFLRLRASPQLNPAGTTGESGMSPEARGSGLGLAIAAAIAARHRGSLSLEDAEPAATPPGLLARLRWPAQAADQLTVP